MVFGVADSLKGGLEQVGQEGGGGLVGTATEWGTGCDGTGEADRERPPPISVLSKEVNTGPRRKELSPFSELAWRG